MFFIVALWRLDYIPDLCCNGPNQTFLWFSPLTSPLSPHTKWFIVHKAHMLMQVNTFTFRFTSSKNAIKPPLSILKELAEFLEVQFLDKGWIEVPPVYLDLLSVDEPHHSSWANTSAFKETWFKSSTTCSEVTTYKMTLATGSLPHQNTRLPRWFTERSVFLRVTADTERKSDSGPLWALFS